MGEIGRKVATCAEQMRQIRTDAPNIASHTHSVIIDN
jgi:hypothetical protein